MVGVIFISGGEIYKIEKESYVLRLALERRGIMELEDEAHADYWARKGWTNTIEKLHIDFDVAFFGNSITRGSDFQQVFKDKKIINLGYSGDNMLGMQRRVSMLTAANPKKVFIMAGTNDLVHIDLEEYKKRYDNLLSAITDSLPNTNVYVESVLPTNHYVGKGNYAPNSKVIKANEIARSLCKKYHCTYIDLYRLYVGADGELKETYTKDGVHLFPKHYDKWSNAIRPYIYISNVQL